MSRSSMRGLVPPEETCVGLHDIMRVVDADMSIQYCNDRRQTVLICAVGLKFITD
jgi:hypothetical protein